MEDPAERGRRPRSFHDCPGGLVRKRSTSHDLSVSNRSDPRLQSCPNGARFACKEDCPEIQRLIQDVLSVPYVDECGKASQSDRRGKELLAFFGFETTSSPESLNFLEDLVDESYQSLVAEDEDGKIIGFVALNHSPRLLANEAQTKEESLSLFRYRWPEWLQATYSINCMWRPLCSANDGTKGSSSSSGRCEPVTAHSTVPPQSDGVPITPSNTLWISFLVYHSTTACSVLASMVEATFASAFELQNLALFNRFGSPTESPVLLPKLFDTFTPLVSQSPVLPKEIHALKVHFCSRNDCIKPLKIRQAEVEDYDDLVKVFDVATELRPADYGEFFLAELIGGQDDRNKCLAAEAHGFAVGLASFTTDIDINLLNNCFELESYDFLVDREYMNKIRTTMTFMQHRGSHMFFPSGGMPSTRGHLYGSGVGDLVQETMRKIPGGFEALLMSVHPNEEGLISVFSLFQSLKKVPQLHELNQAIDIKETLMLIIWQVHFTDASLRSASAITLDQALSAFKVFINIDCLERQRVASFLLEKWDVLATIFAKEELIPGGGAGYGDIPTKRLGRNSSISQFNSICLGKHPHRRSSLASTDRRRSTRTGEVPAESDRDICDCTVKLYHFWEFLLTQSEIHMPPEDISILLLCLHWWGDVPLYHPASDISKEMLKSALQRLSRAALECFAMTYGTPGWLQKLPIDHKNAFAINVFGLDKQWHSQALELILPAFSVFKNKEYCVILQPPSAPVLPFLRYFSPERKKQTSAFSQLLFLLHRQTFLTTPLFREMRETDVATVLEKAASVGLRLSQDAVINAVEDTNADDSDGVASSCEDESAESPTHSQMGDNETSEIANDSRLDSATASVSRRSSSDFDRPGECFVVVGTACSEAVAIAEVRIVRAAELQDVMLKYQLEPYILHHQKRKMQEVRELLDERRASREAKRKLRRIVAPAGETEQEEVIDEKLSYDAFGGHAFIDICLLDSAFQYYGPLLLREAMRLTGAKLLHMVVEPKGHVSPSFYHFFPVKPKAKSAIKYTETIASDHGFFVHETHGTSKLGHSPRADELTAAPVGSRRTVQEDWHFFKTHPATSHLICRPSFLSSYTFTFFHRIVVVGFSSTAYSFLKNLLFANHSFRFKDVTLLAPGGLPLVNRDTKPLLSQSTADYDEASEIRRLLLDLRVRVVDQRIHRIDRRNKLVYLDAGGCTDIVGPSKQPDTVKEEASLTANKRTKSHHPADSELNSPVLPYDFLVLAAGMQDAALQSIGLRSWGLRENHVNSNSPTMVNHADQTWTGKRKARNANSLPQRVNGCISSADPWLYDLLEENGPYLIPLRWNPLTYVVVYGRSLDAYCLVHGLLSRDVPAQKITLILPPRSRATASEPQDQEDEMLPVSEFAEGEPMETKCHDLLRNLGVTVLEGYTLRGVVPDGRGRLKSILLEDASLAEKRIPETASSCLSPRGVVAFKDEDDTVQSRRSFMDELADDWQSRGCAAARSNQLTPFNAPAVTSPFPPVVQENSTVSRLHSLACRVLLTADQRNVDSDVFEAIYQSGLVYDGRLVVNHRFQTSDPFIYGGGSLCEFSREYRPTRKTNLKQDCYSGREIGFYLAASVIRRLNPLFLCPSHPLASSPFFGDRLLDKRILRPPKEFLVPFASAEELFATPTVEELEAYLNRSPDTGKEQGDTNRLACLPRFKFPLCVQGVLAGSLNFYRLSLCTGCLSKHTWWPSHASTSSASNRLPPSQPSSYHSPSHSLSLKAAADSPFSYSPASRTSSSPCSLSSPPSHFPHASPSLTLTSHWSPPDATVPGTCLEGSSPPRPDETEDEREPAEQKTQSNAGDRRIATDTLELSWGDVIESNAGNAETWKHLLSVDGQVVQIDLDELHRMRQFKYLGPTRLRLDAFFFLMGLPISFFSRIQEKRKGGDVADLMAFFSEEEHWFEALLHPRMAKFLRLQQRRLAKDDRINQHVQTAIQNLQGKREDNHQSPMASATIPESRNLSPIKKDTSATVGFDTTTPPSESRIGPAIEGFGLDKTNETSGNTQQNEAEIGEADKKSFPAGESLSKQRQFEQIHLNADFLATFHEGMGRDVKRMIQAELIDFLREHNDELQAFYLPPKETPGQKAGPDA